MNSRSNNLESYPPVFRLQKQKQKHKGRWCDIDDDEEEEDNDERSVIILPVRSSFMNNTNNDIPSIDLESILVLEGLKVEEELGNACKEWGVFRLVNHGIPETLIKQLEIQARDLFSISFQSKQKLFAGGGGFSYFWGTPALTPSGDALHPPHSQHMISWVEGFNIPLSHLSHPQHPLFHSFRVLMEEYGNHMGRIGRRIFEAMLKSLNLEDSIESAAHLSESTGIVRVYRYPKLPPKGKGVGMEVHTDSSVISILNQDDHVAGLELLKDDQWFIVQPIPGSLIINLGDMMQAISNDEYKSVKHRVKVANYRNEEEGERERLSICYFVFPAEGCVIRSSNYIPFTYSQFQSQVQQDINTLGFKLGLPNFKIPPPHRHQQI